MKSAPFCLILMLAPLSAQTTSPGWQHLSTATGGIERPNAGTQQTSATVLDINKDGVNDFVITERTAKPAVTWYLRTKTGWTRHILDNTDITPEAGSTYGDVDGDGDLDFIAGGDGRSNEVWWWENPHPKHDPNTPWKRYNVKQSGARKHHDSLFGDVDGDGKPELVFWNQGSNRLVLARIPPDPAKHRGEWPMTTIFSYTDDSEMLQRATAPPFKRINEHEGIWLVDIDGDGKKDLVGGGYWFKHLGGDMFAAHTVDASYHFSRSIAGQFIDGGRAEIALVVGDGVGPLMLYEWRKGTWHPKTVLPEIDNGHSLMALDFNKDGHLDIFCAEMRLNSGNPDSKVYVLLGDGKGNFKTTNVAEGFDNHESKAADLDGDGHYDVLGKPYNHQTPALNIWLNRGAGR